MLRYFRVCIRLELQIWSLCKTSAPTNTKVAKQVMYTQSIEEFLNVSFQSNTKTRARSTNIFFMQFKRWEEVGKIFYFTDNVLITSYLICKL